MTEIPVSKEQVAGDQRFAQLTSRLFINAPFERLQNDLFKVFLELMGARDPGVRLTADVPDKIGELAAVSTAIASAGGNIIAMGTFFGEESTDRVLTVKVVGLSEEKLAALLKPHVKKITDLRTCC